MGWFAFHPTLQSISIAALILGQSVKCTHELRESDDQVLHPYNHPLRTLQVEVPASILIRN